MNFYTVKWEISLDAESPEEAAEIAWSIMKEPENLANNLDVYEGDSFDESFIKSYEMEQNDNEN